MSDERQAEAKRKLRRGAIAVVLVLLASGAFYGAYRLIANFASAPSQHVMEVVTLKLIQPPPPPPPPPPQVIKPPEPDKMLEQPKELDKPKAEEKPPQPLALDAKAGPGSDSFGLGGRPGGEALIGGDSGGGGGSRFGWYANLMQTQILQTLQKDDKLRDSHYRLVVSLWLSPSGRPERVKLVNTTGNPDIDSRIEATLAAMPGMPQPPPQDMPEPVNLRIDAHG